jgi:hypothetical protein
LKRTITHAYLAAFFLASASVASAQVTTYLGDSNASPRDLTVPNATRATFLSQFAVTGTDNFEGYTPFVPPPPTLTLAGVPTTYSTNGTFIGIDTVQQGSFSVSPVQFLSGNLVLDAQGNPIGVGLTNSFVFSTLVQGFGVYVVNAGDAGNSNTFTVTLQDGPGGTARVYPINANSDGSGSPLTFTGRQFDSTFYFGIEDPVFFDRVTITATSNQDGLVFDDLSVGFISAVPEPTTYALIGSIGLAIAGRRYWLRRKQQQQQESPI